jgi:spore coat polysaccharide biosynthesis predicted glycosyltransferase SpsG
MQIPPVMEKNPDALKLLADSQVKHLTYRIKLFGIAAEDYLGCHFWTVNDAFVKARAAEFVKRKADILVAMIDIEQVVSKFYASHETESADL